MAEQCKISADLVSEERSYVLKVDGYSRVKGLVETGKCVVSTPFSVGGHSWAVSYYPSSDSKDYVNFISLFLRLKSADAEYVKAKFTFSVLDKNRELVPSFSRTLLHTFSSKDSNWGYHDFFKKADLEKSEHLTDDCLTIRCDVTIMKEVHSEGSMVPSSDLHRHLGDLLKNKDAADINFQVGGQRFSAHRCVLAARSSVFKAELLGVMKESSGTPIEIHDMKADVFKSLLHFIYTDTIPPAPESKKGADARGNLVMTGHLLVAANRYDIGRLKLICEEKLCNHIDSDIVATTLALAEQHGFHGLKQACLKFLDCPSNLEAMIANDGFEHLKSSCPSVLKELVTRSLPAELKATKDLIMAIW
ncbi:unnamed protein product [Alopecurus aequalis]